MIQRRLWGDNFKKGEFEIKKFLKLKKKNEICHIIKKGRKVKR